MSISSLFAGMEAYLDGDVEINNNVGTPEGDAEDAEIAEQTAEVASDTADASEEAKDTEVASQMLSRMCDMYDHVKQFGIDRTFVSLYNRHGELDRVCGMRFPSCESMDVVGDRYSMYSTAFIAAMESSGSGLWAKVKEIISKIWNWIKNVASKIWEKIKALFGFKQKRTEKIINFLKQHKSQIVKYGLLTAGAVAAGIAGYKLVCKKWVKKTEQLKQPMETITRNISPFIADVRKFADEPNYEKKQRLLRELKEKYANMDDAARAIYRNEQDDKIAVSDAQSLLDAFDNFCDTQDFHFRQAKNFNQKTADAIKDLLAVANKNKDNALADDYAKFILSCSNDLQKVQAALLKHAAKGNQIDDKIRHLLSTVYARLINNADSTYNAVGNNIRKVDLIKHLQDDYYEEQRYKNGEISNDEYFKYLNDLKEKF